MIDTANLKSPSCLSCTDPSLRKMHATADNNANGNGHDDTSCIMTLHIPNRAEFDETTTLTWVDDHHTIGTNDTSKVVHDSRNHATFAEYNAIEMKQIVEHYTRRQQSPTREQKVVTNDEWAGQIISSSSSMSQHSATPSTVDESLHQRSLVDEVCSQSNHMAEIVANLIQPDHTAIGQQQQRHSPYTILMTNAKKQRRRPYFERLSEPIADALQCIIMGVVSVFRALQQQVGTGWATAVSILLLLGMKLIEQQIHKAMTSMVVFLIGGEL